MNEFGEIAIDSKIIAGKNVRMLTLWRLRVLFAVGRV